MSVECPNCHFENPDDTVFCGKCGTKYSSSEQPPIEHTETLQTPVKVPTKGRTIAEKYEIIEELGKELQNDDLISFVKLKSASSLKLRLPQRLIIPTSVPCTRSMTPKTRYLSPWPVSKDRASKRKSKKAR